MEKDSIITFESLGEVVNSNQAEGVIQIEGITSDEGKINTPPIDTPVPLEVSPTKDSDETLGELPNTSKGLTSFVKSLIDTGEWENLILETPDGDKPLTELEGLTQEQVRLIYKEQNIIKAEKQQAEYMSIKDIPAYKKEVIDIIRSGSKDMVDAIKENPSLIEQPYKEVDLDSPEGRANVYITDLISKGVNQQDALVLAQSAEDRGELKSRATEIVAQVQEKHLEELKKIKEDIISDNARKKEEENIYRKTLKEAYLNKGYDSKKAERLVQIGTERGEDETFKIDELYFQAMSNPETAHLVIEFLSDRDNFLDSIRKNISKDEQLKNMVNLRRISETAPGNKPAVGKTDDYIILQ